MLSLIASVPVREVFKLSRIKCYVYANKKIR